MATIYGYVLLPVSFEKVGAKTITETVEELWESGQFDLERQVSHYHEDGGFAPPFVEATSEMDAIEQMWRPLRTQT